SGEADNKTKLNWIIGNAEDDRDCCCRGLGRKRGRMAACSGNNSHAAAQPRFGLRDNPFLHWRSDALEGIPLTKPTTGMAGCWRRLAAGRDDGRRCAKVAR